MGSDTAIPLPLVPKNGFQSTLPVWGATINNVLSRQNESEFQSTLPVWGATKCRPHNAKHLLNFNPRSPCGERHVPLNHPINFNHFNPRSPCGERHISDLKKRVSKLISIHAPRVGSDSIPRLAKGGIVDISIHAPRVGSDIPHCTHIVNPFSFQSTLPVWGATGTVVLILL